MNNFFKTAFLVFVLFTNVCANAEEAHRFSTVVTAQTVRNELSNDTGLTNALKWCERMNIKKVYLETFRDGYQAEESVLRRAKGIFRSAGIEVSGCITPTRYGKPAKSPRDFHVCHTAAESQERIAEIFSFAAKIFDEIMIDDFWSSHCECDECDSGRKARKVKVAGKTFDVPGDSWGEYRTVLMREVSRTSVLAAARKANPKVKLILKYPNWYDQYHERGYDVIGQTDDFDLIWVGNETREIDNPYHPGIPQYAGYFIQRWLQGIGGEKCGGGWYDAMESTPPTYVEQARQTILGGARESVLFTYGRLNPAVTSETPRPQVRHGHDDAEALLKEMPDLQEVARNVQSRKIVGIAAYKPPGSSAGEDFHIFDFAGMVGLPLAPCHEFPHDAKAAMFALYALKDPNFQTHLAKFINSGRPVLITRTLAAKLPASLDLSATNVTVLKLDGKPRTWMNWSKDELGKIRAPLLKPLGVTFEAPAGVALYLFEDKSYVVENFTGSPATVRLNGKEIKVLNRGWVKDWR